MSVAATGAYKSDPDFFTFPIYVLTKDLTKNFEKKLGVPPVLAPQKRSLKKMTPPWLPMTPNFYHRICFSYKNENVCKKPELQIFIFDRATPILSSKIQIF